MTGPSGKLPSGSGRSYVPPSRIAWWMPVLLGVLTAVGPISTDIYLPAFPAMMRSLHTSLGSVQMTLSVWFAGLAIGQLTVGPLSDALGRRRPMIAGNLLFAVASAVCAWAPDITTFSIARFVASIGASASLVVPTACVRDMVPDRTAGARMMSRLVVVMGVVPVLAPMLGGLVVTLVSWRVIFWASAVYGLVCALLVLRFLPETLPRGRRYRLSPWVFAERYKLLLLNRMFLSHAMTGSFSTFMSFSYLTAASPVFILDFGFTPFQFSMLFGVFAVFMIGASRWNGSLVTRVDPGRVLTLSVYVALVGCMVLMGISVWDSLFPGQPGHPKAEFQAFLTIVAMIVALGATGLIYPNATMGALSDFPHLAGAASALSGTLQYVMGAIAGTVVGSLPGGTSLPMAAGMLAGAAGMLIAARFRPAAAAKSGP
ncbi:multidrug effflux MFS transporter [Acetobacter sp. AN02]|uniref:multidrug effflux MFS transporter n=1 Tax=Acetobacter sp. AN02 TaxID=2894186 RepID=UPI0024343C1E|nr:multidrug effflux MFS transporter [Acetobacter sp. AN02]MDG6095209.1 multidrug effflux MFS transporter [Acetobacter sp. AN02]